MSNSIKERSSNSSTPFKTILTAGFTAGLLDILAAIIVYSFIMNKATPVQILQSVASGVFGKDAFAGDTSMAVYGLLFHFIIAVIFAAIYFFIYPLLPFVKKQKVIRGLLYGIVVWLIMNLLVVPNSNAGQAPFKWSAALIGCSILMLCIGLPIALITNKYYQSKN